MIRFQLHVVAIWLLFAVTLFFCPTVEVAYALGFLPQEFLSLHSYQPQHCLSFQVDYSLTFSIHFGILKANVE